MTKKILSLAVFAVFIGLSACKDDEAPAQLSKTEATGKISEFNTSASSDLSDLGDTDGLKTVKEFFNLVDTDDPFSRMGSDRKGIRAFFRHKGREFKAVFVQQKALGGRTQEDGFNYEENLGVYAWNPQLGEVGQFELIDDSEIIVIQFPTEGSSTNNAELRLTDYAEVEVYDEEKESYYYEPTVLSAALLVDGTEVASLDLNAEWDETGFPLSANITVEVAPYKATLIFDDSNATSSSVSASLLRSNETIIAVNVTANYQDASKSSESLNTLEGFVQFRNVKLQGKIDNQELSKQEVDWNKVVVLALYADDSKLGDVKFFEENGEGVAYLVYADGSKEKLETVLKPVIDEIESITEDLKDDNG